jgi:hypothetical protein
MEHPYMFDNSIYSFAINKKRERPDSPILKITNNFKKIKFNKSNKNNDIKNNSNKNNDIKINKRFANINLNNKSKQLKIS